MTRSSPKHAMRAVLSVALFAGFLGVTGAGDAAVAPAESLSCTPSAECCKVCRKGHACGNSCISRKYDCHKGRGCACNAEEICGS